MLLLIQPLTTLMPIIFIGNLKERTKGRGQGWKRGETMLVVGSDGGVRLCVSVCMCICVCVKEA